MGALASHPGQEPKDPEMGEGWPQGDTFMHWRRKCQPTPVFLPGESQGRGTQEQLVWGRSVHAQTSVPHERNRVLAFCAVLFRRLSLGCCFDPCGAMWHPLSWPMGSPSGWAWVVRPRVAL